MVTWYFRNWPLPLAVGCLSTKTMKHHHGLNRIIIGEEKLALQGAPLGRSDVSGLNDEDLTQVSGDKFNLFSMYAARCSCPLCGVNFGCTSAHVQTACISFAARCWCRGTQLESSFSILTDEQAFAAILLVVNELREARRALTNEVDTL